MVLTRVNHAARICMVYRKMTAAEIAAFEQQRIAPEPLPMVAA